MVDEFRSIRDSLFKTLSGLPLTIKDPFDLSGGDDTLDDDADGSSSGTDTRAARALIAALFARAGKSKDELVQTIAREIGLTVAAMLKEPLSQIAKHQKLQISFELVPKGKESADRGTPREGRSRPKRRITKRSSPRHKVGKSGA